MSEAVEAIVIGPEQKKKLTHTVKDALEILENIRAERESLKDLIKAVAEELNVTPKSLRTAIRIANKANLADEKVEFEQVLDILQATGFGE